VEQELVKHCALAHTDVLEYELPMNISLNAVVRSNDDNPDMPLSLKETALGGLLLESVRYFRILSPAASLSDLSISLGNVSVR
jgi:hypothetical protein